MIRLFHGKNTFLSKRDATATIDKIRTSLDKAKTTYDFITFDATEVSANKILNEIQTSALFVQHKVVFLKRPSQNPSKEELMEQLLRAFDGQDNNLPLDLVIWEDKKIAANTKIAKAFKKIDAIQESPELNKRSFLSWAKQEAANMKVKITPSAIHLLSERSNYLPERFTRELEKISLLGNKTISDTDVQSVCPDTLEHTIWEIIDGINDPRNSSARQNLDLLFRQGNEPFYVLLMIARNYRILLLTKVLLDQGLTTSEIASKIRVHPFTINMTKRAAQSTSLERIKKIYDKLSNIDYSGKTGQLDVELALNILLSVI